MGVRGLWTYCLYGVLMGRNFLPSDLNPPHTSLPPPPKKVWPVEEKREEDEDVEDGSEDFIWFLNWI